ncbi:MAG: hypothetical protein IAF02_04180 [Anaerolineae bacterium]|nr:hypothetical protein [Anaerolineae bacterium]
MKIHEKRLYLANSLSQQLILLYIAGNTLFTIVYVNHMAVDVQLGVFVMLNIFLSLVAFLMAARQKVYAIRWGYAGVAMALFQFARMLWVPEEITGTMRIFLMALLVATALSALAGSIICIQRARERQNYIVDNNIDLASLQQ